MKYEASFLDRASASWLWAPGRWVAEVIKLNFADINTRLLIRCMTLWSLLLPEFITATTGALSLRIRTDFPTQLFPQTAAASTIGMSSLMVMCLCLVVSSHCSWNQESLQYAPHPQLPEASDVITTSGFSLLCSSSMETPFQLAANWYHHWISDLAATLSLTWWSRRHTCFARLTSRRRKDRPWWTALCVRKCADKWKKVSFKPLFLASPFPCLLLQPFKLVCWQADLQLQCVELYAQKWYYWCRAFELIFFDRCSGDFAGIPHYCQIATAFFRARPTHCDKIIGIVKYVVNSSLRDYPQQSVSYSWKYYGGWPEPERQTFVNKNSSLGVACRLGEWVCCGMPPSHPSLPTGSPAQSSMHCVMSSMDT